MKTARTAGLQSSATAHDLPALLRERLRTAMRRNPRFSLRAFARQLAIDHSTLSQVLRGKRRLSARAVEAAGHHMGLSDAAIRACTEGLKRKRNREGSPPDIQNLHFDLDTFLLLAIWYHYAILELIQVRGFKADSRWLASTLGIAVEDVNIALQRLLRLGLLEMVGPDRWLDKSGDAEFHTAALTQAAANRIQQEIHELAIEAIPRIPAEHRVHQHMVSAIDSRQLSRLRSLTADFLEKVRAIATEKSPRDDVYQIEVSIFPVTTLKKERGGKDGESRDALADPDEAAQET